MRIDKLLPFVLVMAACGGEDRSYRDTATPDAGFAGPENMGPQPEDPASDPAPPLTEGCLGEYCSTQVSDCGDDCRALYECLWQCEPEDSSCQNACEGVTPGPAIGELQTVAACYQARCAPGAVPQTCVELIRTHCTAELRVCDSMACNTVRGCIQLCGPQPTEQCDAELRAICDDLTDADYVAYLEVLGCASANCLSGDDLSWALFLAL